MTQNEQALARLEALESEAAALRLILQKPNRSPSLLTKPVAGSYETFYFLEDNPDNLTMCVGHGNAIPAPSSFYEGANCFQSKAIAEAYIDAINTMLLLRHQPGTVEIEDDVPQWGIVPCIGLLNLSIDYWTTSRHLKIRAISPFFDTEENVRAAINKIGEKRILQMFKTFHGIYK